MFYKHFPGDKIVILIVYVDDIIITGDCIEEMEKEKALFAQEFEIKDLGMLRYFLGWKYLDTSTRPNNKLGMIEESLPMEKGQYQRLVGKLIYLSYTFPNIAFPINVIS